MGNFAENLNLGNRVRPPPGLKSGQKQGGAVYVPVPQKLYQQLPKH